MQSGSNPHLDANAADSPEIREDDPRHLGNLTKKMSSMNNQVSADTKYDPVSPPRIGADGAPINERFTSPLPNNDENFAEKMYIICGITLIIMVLATIIIIDPNLRKIVNSVSYGNVLIGSTFVLCLSILGFIRYSLHVNEIQKWYPIPQYTS